MAEGNKTQNETFATTLKSSMDGMLNSLLKAQEAFEVKCDRRLDTLEESMTKRQDETDQKNESKFSEMQEQISLLSKAVYQQPPGQSTLPEQQAAVSLPPHPTSLPHPTFANILKQATVRHPGVSSEDLDKIKDIVCNARTIIGLGPISANDIEDTPATNPGDKLLLAVIDFLKNEIGMKESEIRSDDIKSVFAADDPSLQRVYVQFSSKEQADLCLDLTRRLRKPELKVVLYVPNQLKKRFHAIKSEDYRLRKLTTPRHKTRIEYSDDDLALYICPVGHFSYVLHPVPGLPAVDLAPARTPPPGRKTKRDRSESASPNAADKKKERVDGASADVNESSQDLN